MIKTQSLSQCVASLCVREILHTGLFVLIKMPAWQCDKQLPAPFQGFINSFFDRYLATADRFQLRFNSLSLSNWPRCRQRRNDSLFDDASSGSLFLGLFCYERGAFHTSSVVCHWCNTLGWAVVGTRRVALIWKNYISLIRVELIPWSLHTDCRADFFFFFLKRLTHPCLCACDARRKSVHLFLSKWDTKSNGHVGMWNCW